MVPPFAGAAKLTTAWFLIERARLVLSPAIPRLHDRLYLFNLALSLIWFAALILILVVRSSRLRASDNECLVSMGRGPAIGVIAIDAFLNIYYTSLFAVPLLRGRWKNPKLRQLAIKSALAAVLTVSSSVANLGVMAAHGGTELSWVCLSTCTLDTVWCAMVLCGLTSHRDDADAAAATASVGPAATFGLSLNDPVWRAATLAQDDDKLDKDQPPSTPWEGHSPLHPGTPFGSPPGEHAAPLASWGSFGRLGPADEEEVGVESGGRTERRLSTAPEEMCLGAVNERKCVDGAWRARSPRNEEGWEAGGKFEGKRVGFAEMLGDGTGR